MSTLPNEQEESLREACGIGDSLTVQTLLSQGVDVNSQNAMNGWYVNEHKDQIHYSEEL